jgi:hypothetical protein
MNNWRVAGQDEFEGLLEAEVALLHPKHRSMIDAMHVSLRQVHVSRDGDDRVFILPNTKV